MQREFFRNNNRRPGQYLVEVLVSLGVFMIVIGALATLHIDAQKIQLDATMRTKAEQYAQEGANAIFSIQKSSWSKLTPGAHGLSSSGGTWTLTGVSDSQGDLTRQITIAWQKRNGTGNIDPSGSADPFGKKVSVVIKRTSDLAVLSEQFFYITYPEGKQWKHTTQADFSAGTKTDTTDTPAGDGALTLSQNGASTTGFSFEIASLANDLKLSSSTTKVSFRLTPTLTQPITETRVYVSALQNSPTYRIGIQGSDVNGLPNGAWLGQTNNGFGSFRPTTTGWQIIPLNENVQVANGQTVHVVIQYESGTINANRYATLLATNPNNAILPPNGAANAQLQTLFTTTGTWQAKNYQPVVVLRSTSNEYFGNPYSATGSSQVFGTTLAGQRYTTGPNPEAVTSIGMFVSRTSNPVGNLTLSVRNIATNTVVAQGTLATPSQVTTSFAWQTLTFASPLTLQPLTSYRFELSSAASASNRRFNVATISTVASAPYPALTYKTDQGFFEQKIGSGNWTSATQTDLPFKMTVQGGFASSGTYLSPAFDTGSATSVLATFAWNGTIPALTTMTLQLRTANTQAGLSSATWIGPDGTSSTTFSSLDSITLSAGATGSRWIQYRAQFATSDTAITPQLDDVTIVYGP